MIGARNTRELLRASMEAQLGCGMCPEALEIIDAVCASCGRNDGDLVALHQSMFLLHAVEVGVEGGSVTRDEVLAALRMTMTAKERGEDPAEALARHLVPLLPAQEICL
jgi:hypothetical protein